MGALVQRQLDNNPEQAENGRPLMSAAQLQAIESQRNAFVRRRSPWNTTDEIDYEAFETIRKSLEKKGAVYARSDHLHGHGHASRWDDISPFRKRSDLKVP